MLIHFKFDKKMITNIKIYAINVKGSVIRIYIYMIKLSKVLYLHKYLYNLFLGFGFKYIIKYIVI